MLVKSIPKPQKKKHRARRNPRPTAEDMCRYCGTPYASLHEIFEGNGRRQLSIKYGMQVRLCPICHRDVQTHPLQGRDLELKQEFQQKFIDQYGYARWMKEFGRDYM